MGSNEGQLLAQLARIGLAMPHSNLDRLMKLCLGFAAAPKSSF